MKQSAGARKPISHGRFCRKSFLNRQEDGNPLPYMQCVCVHLSTDASIFIVRCVCTNLYIVYICAQHMQHMLVCMHVCISALYITFIDLGIADFNWMSCEFLVCLDYEMNTKAHDGNKPQGISLYCTLLSF